MKPDFYWTARRIENGSVQEERFFPAREDRDRFVAGHEGWSRRGKVCARTVERRAAAESLEFRDQLRELGLREGDTVIVHSSMRSLGTVRSPKEVIEDIRAVLGEEGTLLFPALTYDNVTPEQPVFESDKTEPCIGLLPVVFWRMKGVVRSVHPTHSVCAAGKYARELTESHRSDETPVGPHSPYRLLLRYGGKILMLGDVLDCCTFMHGVEEIGGAPYTLTKERIRYVADGEEKFLFGHDFEGWEQRYDRIAGIMGEPELKKGKAGKGPAWLIDAAALLKAALEKMKEDPYFFVEPAGEEQKPGE